MYKRGNVTLIRGDCIKLHETLVGVDAVVSDPPYGMKNNNGYSRLGGSLQSHGKQSSRTYKPTIGDDKPFDPTPFLCYKYVVLWGYNHFASRLPVGTTLVWVKRNEEAYGSFLSDAEVAWMKGGKGVYLNKDLSMNAITRTKFHPNQKPVKLMEWCIGKVPKAKHILDPFLGSGSTAIAAINLGVTFTGIEIDKGYYDAACRRVDEALDVKGVASCN